MKIKIEGGTLLYTDDLFAVMDDYAEQKITIDELKHRVRERTITVSPGTELEACLHSTLPTPTDDGITEQYVTEVDGKAYKFWRISHAQ